MKGFAFAAMFGLLLLGALPASAEDSFDSGYSTDPRPSLLAPADRYFGRFRMSILGIRNAIKDVAVRVDLASSDELPSLFHKLTLVEDALGDLRRRYPMDSWLPQLGLNIAQAFQKFPYDAARVHANDNFDWLIAEYPESDQAVYALDLRDGGERLPPVSSMDVPIEPVLPSYAVPSP